MRAFMLTVFCASICSAAVLVGAAESPLENSNTTAFFQRLTQQYEDAYQARDLDTVAQIEADDWRSVGTSGKAWTKEMDLDGMRSGKVKHVPADLGPIDVKMLGDAVAVVQGTLTDRNTGAAYAYMDVWVKRGGKWQVVRSQSTKLN